MTGTDCSCPAPTDYFFPDRRLKEHEELALAFAHDPVHRLQAGGKTSARAIARMYAALLGEVDGIRLVSPRRLREATAVAMSDTDHVFGMPTTWALGYSIGRLGASPKDSATTFGVGGAGGSFACGDTASGIAFAVTKNMLRSDFSAAICLSQIVFEALGKR